MAKPTVEANGFHPGHALQAHPPLGEDGREAHTAPVKVAADGVSIGYRTGDRGSFLAVDDVSFNVYAAELMCIIGPSGCGKSSLLHAMAGLTSVTRGQILIDGRQVTAPSPDRAVVFQRPCLLPWRTVHANVTYGLELKAHRKDYGRRIDSTWVDELLELVGLAAYRDRRPGELSGGMQQRVNLARALAVRPSALLMDEPFSALDAYLRSELQVAIRKLMPQLNVTVVFVTHDIREALLLADRVIVMSSSPGKIADTISVDLPPDRDRTILRSGACTDYEDYIESLLGVSTGSA